MRLTSTLLTGASSGIGRALAVACAGPGRTLHLTGRDAARLEQTASACRARGALVETRTLDVADEAAMAAWIADLGPLDLVLACAGLSGGPRRPGPGRARQEDAAQIRQIFSVNLEGVVNTVLPAIAVMEQQPPIDGVRGRIAAIASVAAALSSPLAPAYGASKAAVDRWLVANGGAFAREGIQLSSVCCGFVRTPMTAQNRFSMPGMVEPERAASLILRGIAAGRRRVVFPWWVYASARVMDLLPVAAAEALLNRQPPKPPQTGR